MWKIAKAREAFIKKAAQEAAQVAAVKAAKEGEKLAEKAAKKGLEKVGKRIGSALAKKAGALGVALTVSSFAYDYYEGGLGHAVNEAVWPVSELWGGE